jgi:hypothetical protein
MKRHSQSRFGKETENSSSELSRGHAPLALNDPATRRISSPEAPGGMILKRTCARCVEIVTDCFTRSESTHSPSASHLSESGLSPTGGLSMTTEENGLDRHRTGGNGARLHETRSDILTGHPTSAVWALSND